MFQAVSNSVALVAYLALFAGVGLLFVFVNLLIGRFVRPANPHAEKLETYECGEPAIGSSFVQFDLRFYVVALLFIIFDVEVAFFFPWATVFGKATHLTDPQLPVVQGATDAPQLTPEAAGLYQELGVRRPVVPRRVPASLAAVAVSQVDRPEQVIRQGARQLALLTLLDIAVFFGVLLVGFAYVWWRGDLDWVRATTRQQPRRAPAEPPQPQQPVLTA